MAGIGYKFTVKDLGMGKRLDTLAANLKGVERPLFACGQQMLRSIEKNFQAGGRPNRWVPLAESTRKQKAKRGYTKPLIRTADLKNSITAEVRGNTVVAGTNKVYGRIQQKGGKAGRGRKVTIPARPYVVIQPEDRRIFKRIFRDHAMSK